MTSVARSTPPPPSTDDAISIVVPGSADVRPPARDAFAKAVEEYAVDLLAEASLAEASANGSSSTVAQYTTGHFDESKVVVRQRGFVERRSPWYYIARVLAPIGFFVGGVMIPQAFETPPDAMAGVVGAGVAGGAVVASLVVEFLGDGSGKKRKKR